MRKQIYYQKEQRASKGKFDNRPLALELLQLDYQKAQLMGYPSAAHMHLATTMAQTPDQVFDFIASIASKAKQKAQSELQMLKEYFGLTAIDPRDVNYYARKYKEEKFALDEEKLKQYFEFENTLTWLHDFAKRFFGIELRKIISASSSEEIRWYEVYKDGEFIAYYFLDAFYRPGKRPGAWADQLRTLTPTAPQIILNVCNFQKAEN